MEYNTIAYNLYNRCCNTKRWSTSQRESRGTKDVPGPAEYQRDISALKSFKQNRYPFNQKCPRDLPEDPRGKDSPSVGTYDWFMKPRQFEWQRDTNLKPINLPQITFKSTVCANTDKLPYSREERKYQRRLRCFENYFKEDITNKDSISLK